MTNSSSQNWDGDNPLGNFNLSDNWYGNTVPAAGSDKTLSFNFRNNSSQTSIYYDWGWADFNTIIYAATFPVGIPFNGNGNGINVFWKIENNSNHSQTINIPTSFKGIGAELNPINGDLIIGGIISNDYNRDFNVFFGSAIKSLILNNYVVGNNTVNLDMKNSNYGIVQINCNMPGLSTSSFSGGILINRGELWFNSGSAINGGVITLGNSDANTCKLFINDSDGGTTIDNAVSVPASSSNCFIGGLNTSGTNTFSGSITAIGSLTIEIVNINGSISFTNDISGSGAISKIGPGTAVFEGAKTYNGTTTVSAGTLEIQGDLASSLITVASGAKLRINGSDVDINALTIESGGIVEILAGKSLTINGTLTNGADATGLVIESGGSLITKGTVSGSATIKREIAEDFKWHFLSSPVSGQIICDGNFAPLAINFNAGTGATYDFYKWSEPVVSGNLNWINLKNSDWSLNTGAYGATPEFDVAKGYLVAYGSEFAGSSSKSFAGALTSGDQTVTLTTGGNQWNLIGNPFASAINWDGVTKTTLVDGYYSVYNENKSGGAGYEYYLDGTHKSSGANGKISATQGFFIKANGASIVLPNAARVHDNNWMKNTEVIPPDQLVLKLSHGSNYDEAFIQFETQGTTGKDFFDAEKMFSFSSGIPQVYTTLENEVKVAFNSMPLNSELFSIPLGVYIPANGDYVLDISNIEGLTTSAGVVLEDLKINVLQDLNTDPSYQFTSSVNDDPDRFILHFGTVGISTPTQENPAVIYSHGGVIFVTGAPANAEITVSNLTGQMMLQGKSAGNSLTSLNAATLPKGIYVVSVLSNGQLTSRKVVL